MAKQEEASGPGLAGPIVAAFISILIGGVLAAANLIILPVSVVKEIPPEEELVPKTVYFISGGDQGGNTWKQKKTFLASGQSGARSLSEGELNRWAKSTFKPNPQTDEEGGLFSKISMVPETPNFRIVDDQLQVSSQLEIPILGEGKKFLYQAKGNFVNESGVNKFKAESGYIGTCPIPKFAGLPDIVFNLLAAKFLLSEEYDALNPNWSQLSQVVIEDNQIKLVR